MTDLLFEFGFGYILISLIIVVLVDVKTIRDDKIGNEKLVRSIKRSFAASVVSAFLTALLFAMAMDDRSALAVIICGGAFIPLLLILPWVKFGILRLVHKLFRER